MADTFEGRYGEGVSFTDERHSPLLLQANRTGDQKREVVRYRRG
jgi:hypothetical protein